MNATANTEKYNRVKSFLVYAAKLVTGALLVNLCATFVPYIDVTWSLISVVLVLSPDRKDSITLAVTRMKANLVAGAVSLLCLLFAPVTPVLIMASLVATLMVCYLLKLDSGMRSALAATIIILLHGQATHLWDTAVARITAVLAGCVVGLASTFIFHFRSWNYNKIFHLSGEEG